MPNQVEAGLVLHSDREVPILAFPELEANSRFVHGITTRFGGVSASPYRYLNLSADVGDSPAAVQENRARAARAVGLIGRTQVRCRLEHGNSVATIGKHNSTEQPTADAVVTNNIEPALTMTFADCVPIILVDNAAPALALVHAGWRGTVSGVALAAWEAMRALGAREETSTAYLGPAVGGCCYRVGDEVVERVLPMGRAGTDSLDSRDGITYLDLSGLNARLLEERGVRTVRSNCCTACRTDLLYSHRAEAGRTGRFAVYAALA